MAALGHLSDDSLMDELRRRGHVPVLMSVADAVVLLEADDRGGNLRGESAVAMAKSLLRRSSDAIVDGADMAGRECLVAELARSRRELYAEAGIPLADHDGKQADLPEIGTRVVLKADFETFPTGVFAAGETGEVTVSEPDMIGLKLDTHYPELDEWDNCLMFYTDGVGQTREQMVEEFWGYAEPAPAHAHGM